MTLQEFINKYNGKAVDFDGYYGNQCVDLSQQYNKEMFNGPFLSGAAAKDIWNTYPQSIYDRVANSPTGVPLPGDIIIWGSSYGPYGHIAICISANVDNFKCLSQNDPSGALTGIKDYPNYNGVLGWLHPKVGVIVDTPVVDDCPAKLKQITEERDRLNGVITGKDETINHLGATIDQKNSELATLQAIVSKDKETLLITQQQLSTAQEQALKVPSLTEQLEQAEETKKLYAGQVTALQTQISKIKSQLVPKKYLSKKLYDIIMVLE